MANTLHKLNGLDMISDKFLFNFCKINDFYDSIVLRHLQYPTCVCNVIPIDASDKK